MTKGSIEVPARRGKVVELLKDAAIEIINSQGHQAVDYWAFHAGDVATHLSMAHTRAVLSKVSRSRGDTLLDNLRQQVLNLEEDTFSALHDSLIPPCDKARYELLGYPTYHANCQDNMFEAMREIGLEPGTCPASLNLWMNIPIGSGGDLQWLPPVSRKGDLVRFRALADLLVVMSVCPQDIVPINANEPVSVHFRVLRQ